MKVRILQRFFDIVEGVYYEPSTDYIDVKEHVAKRLTEKGETVAIFKKDDEPTSDKTTTKSKRTK